MSPSPPTPSPPTTPLSILDLAIVAGGASEREALDGCVALAQHAEELGYRRVWYAEHHNMTSIASSAPAVLIAHVAAHTESILLGSGGVMLPNHSPLTIAEQFGMLATLHPGRIELGLGRAPGTDLPTVRAMRRDPAAAESFPATCWSSGATWPARAPCPASGPYRGPGPRCRCTCWAPRCSARSWPPGSACRTPSPRTSPPRHSPCGRALREQFEPSEQLAEPRVLAAMNVIAAHDASAARDEFDAVLRARVAMFLAGGRRLSDAELDAW